MLIAVPTIQGSFTPHFGRCDGFFICLISPERAITQPRLLPRPRPGKCESLPEWLKRVGVTTLIAGGIGEIARQRLTLAGIAIHVGYAGDDPSSIVAQFLTGNDRPNANACSTLEHRHHHCRK